MKSQQRNVTIWLDQENILLTTPLQQLLKHHLAHHIHSICDICPFSLLSF